MDDSLLIGRDEFGRSEDLGRLPSRTEALALLGNWVANDRLRLHMRQVAALLEVWARDKLSLAPAEVDKWYLAGLLHDADCDKWPETHPQKVISHLEEGHYDPELIHGIAAHGPRHFGVAAKTNLDRMIFAVDELSGFVHACSLVRPEGYNGMEVSSVKKKLKNVGFAAQVDRQDIAEGAESAGLALDDLIAFVIATQKEVH
ncbi:MAG: HD domain-containing protein [Spirochaetales bacterium]